jgi:hypothetical protein
MTRHLTRGLLTAAFIAATASVARADVCVSIDSERDTLTAADRTAALTLLTRQFELAGERVVGAGCEKAYTVLHVQLGNAIVVSITGPAQREATAQGLEELPALYNQMVRSIVTGEPMNGFNVVDRSNVLSSQASVRRVHSDSIWYGRLGGGALFGDTGYGTPGFGFGYRAELDRFGIDLSFLNFQVPATESYDSSRATAASFLKLSALYFLDPKSNRTAYLGSGLSYGRQSFGGGADPFRGTYRSDWEGSGLQGELTVGYELARATTMRVFVQADATLPFYQAASETYTVTRFGPANVTTDRRYAPSLVFSIGLGR